MTSSEREELLSRWASPSSDTSGKIAVNIAAVAGSRPSADVVPSFDYRIYLDCSSPGRHPRTRAPGATCRVPGRCLADGSLCLHLAWP